MIWAQWAILSCQGLSFVVGLIGIFVFTGKHETPQQNRACKAVLLAIANVGLVLCAGGLSHTFGWTHE